MRNSKDGQAGRHGDLIEFTITPTKATEWLQFSRKGNEYRLTDRTVDQYAQFMKNGQWHYTGEPIIFGDDELILDGHHRLNACVRAGVPFVTDVIFGRPREAFAYIDSGKVRTTYHIAGIEGVPEPRVSSVAFKWMYRFEHGKLSRQGYDLKLPAWAIPEMYQKHPTLPYSVKLVPYGISNFLTIGVSVFLHYYLSTIDATATEQFFERFAVGNNLGDGNPILILRNMLIHRRGIVRNKLRRRDDRDNLHEIALVIKAWNHWRDGKRIKFLKWQEGEAFPKPH